MTLDKAMAPRFRDFHYEAAICATIGMRGFHARFLSYRRPQIKGPRAIFVRAIERELNIAGGLLLAEADKSSTSSLSHHEPTIGAVMNKTCYAAL